MPPSNLAGALSEFRATVQAIRDAYPGLTDEDLADTIEGEALGLEAAIINTLRAALEREAAAEGLKGLAAQMTARMNRLSEGAQMLRRAALNAMTEAGIKKIPANDMSVSVGVGKPKVIITDEAELPDSVCKYTRTPNKVAIAAVIAGGGSVSGAELSNPQPFLSIHRS